MNHSLCVNEPIIINSTLKSMTNANNDQHVLTLDVAKAGTVIGWCFNAQNNVLYLCIKELTEFVGNNPWSCEEYDEVAMVAFREPQKKERLQPIQIGAITLNNRCMNDAAQVWIEKYGSQLVKITMHKQHRDDSEAKCRKYVIHGLNGDKQICTSIKRCVEHVASVTGRNFEDDLRKDPNSFLVDATNQRKRRDSGKEPSGKRQKEFGAGPSSSTTVVEVSA
jgi:hypothetical protein